MKRTVVGILKNSINDIPIPNAEIVVEFVPGSYQNTVLYTPTYTTITTDNQGVFAIDLWCNETGNQSSYYYLTLPGHTQPVKFVVPEGTTEIPLTVLLEASTVDNSDPQYKTLVTFLQTQLANNTQRESFVISNSQSINKQLILTKTPSFPHLSSLFVNGIEQIYALDYNINTNIVNWLSTVNLEAGWRVQIFYS